MRATELTRIDAHPEVARGDRIRLTGKVHFGSEPFLVRLGSDITIADGVRFITHDGGARVFRDEYPELHIYSPITVGSRVFIGIGATIMPGVSIGDRSVIGAGSIVTKDVPSGEVWAGVPARRIKTSEQYKADLLNKGINWPTGKYDEAWKAHLLSLYRSDS